MANAFSKSYGSRLTPFEQVNEEKLKNFLTYLSGSEIG